jgi:hypothetical protein
MVDTAARNRTTQSNQPQVLAPTRHDFSEQEKNKNNDNNNPAQGSTDHSVCFAPDANLSRSHVPHVTGRYFTNEKVRNPSPASLP